MAPEQAAADIPETETGKPPRPADDLAVVNHVRYMAAFDYENGIFHDQHIMNAIRIIALNTFRETIRDRILYNVLLFVAGILFLAMVVSDWSIGQQIKILKDFGLTIITFFGLLIGVFIGIGLVYKEIDRRTIYTILSKPVKRWQFLLGKYFGLLITLLLNFLLMTIALYVVLWFTSHEFSGRMLVAILMIYGEMTIIMAFTILFSSFTTPTLSAMLCIFIFISGHLSSSFRFFGPGVEQEWFAHLLSVLYFLLPNLEFFNYTLQVVHHEPFVLQEIMLTVLYAIGYTSLILFLALWIFQRRDFK